MINFEDKKIIVYSPLELEKRQKLSLEKILENFTGKKNCRITYEIDKDLIAGLKIKIGSRVIDFSLASKLDGESTTK